MKKRPINTIRLNELTEWSIQLTNIIGSANHWSSLASGETKILYSNIEACAEVLDEAIDELIRLIANNDDTWHSKCNVKCGINNDCDDLPF